MRIVYVFSLLALLASCNEQNVKEEKKETDTSILKSTVDSVRIPVVNHLNDYIFQSGDSIIVTLQKDDLTPKKLHFKVETKNENFEGVANLELIEDNGKYYLPESTPRLDEKTNKEYMCDSTFSYQSEKISFVFAMENKTQKRLSFIINNSSIASVGDNFYTLYKKN